MSIFRRRQSVEESLQLALGRIYESQAKQIEAMSTLLEKMAEISMKRAASALGSRGGQQTAKRKAAKRALEQARIESPCKLCRDPLSRNLSITDIQRHQAHELAIDVTDQANGTAPQ
jgi:hypothetical protein